MVVYCKYYDKFGRLLQNWQSNPDGGYNRVSTVYNFTGQPTKQQTYHRRTSGSTSITINEAFAYDHMGRPTTVKHGYNTSSLTTIAQFTYDELGRQTKKELHNGYQDMDYQYNIRGWLTKINDPSSSYSNSKLFAMELYYNSVSPLTYLDEYAQNNGNISGIRWRNNDTKRAGYAFRYDGLNRLTKADYGYTNSSGNLSNYSYYDVSPITYDKNGNIQSLTRKTSSGSNREALTYTYNGNQLSSLSGTFSESSISNKTFSYDDNGNAIADNLRGINIEYFEELNLPKKYSNASKNTQYKYDASGVKWQKTTNAAGASNIEYYGNFIYQGGTLDKVLTSEGFYDAQSGIYHYYLKDHLGNNRITFHYSGSTAVVDQEVDYYPFGSMHTVAGTSVNKYLYNGKELNNEFFENYDYGARMYDPALVLFTTQDPQAESYYPYNYVGGNPIIRVDENGEFWGAVIGAFVDAGLQVAEIALDDNKTISDFSRTSVGVSAVTGGLVTKNGTNS